MSGATQINAGQRAQAGVTNQNLAQPWSTATLLNGWTNFAAGTVQCQYRMLNQVTVEVIGVIKSGTTTGGTVIFSLPAGFFNPNNAQGVIGFLWGATPTLTWFQVTTAGNFVVDGTVAASTSYFFHGHISLDA